MSASYENKMKNTKEFSARFSAHPHEMQLITCKLLSKVTLMEATSTFLCFFDLKHELLAQTCTQNPCQTHSPSENPCSCQRRILKQDSYVLPLSNNHLGMASLYLQESVHKLVKCVYFLTLAS